MRIITMTSDTYRKNSHLMQQMFVDRAIQFRDRLDWDVQVSDNGEERDKYDCLKPIYLVAQSDSGKHLGSMRFLSLSGPTMLFDHFSELIPPNFLTKTNEYECTRFCISPNLDKRMAKFMISSLLLEGCRLALRLGCPSTLGIFHPIMLRVYRLSGWSPNVLGVKAIKGETIMFGRWDVNRNQKIKLESRVSEQVSSNTSVLLNCL